MHQTSSPREPCSNHIPIWEYVKLGRVGRVGQVGQVGLVGNLRSLLPDLPDQPDLLNRPDLRWDRHLDKRPDLDGPRSRGWDASGESDRFVEILGLDEIVATELFARLGEWSIGHQALAVAYANRRGGGRGLQLRPADIVAA